MAQALSISLALQPALFHSTPSSSPSTCIPGVHTPSSSILHLSRKSSSLSLSSASFPRSSSEPSLFLPRFRSRAGTTAATFVAPTLASSATDHLGVRSETSATRASHRSPLSSCLSGEHHNNNNHSCDAIAANSITADPHATETNSASDSIELSAPASGISCSTSLSPTRSSSLRRHSHSEVSAHSSHSEPIPSPHQPSIHSADSGSVLWKAYTRVKQTIVENPNTQQLEKTMTDYWHSFSAPPQPRDLEEHPTDTALSSFVVPTPPAVSTSTSTSASASSPRTVVETGSLLKSSVRSASEHGLLLAQRSKTSLNRLLDTVMDNATTLAESSSANCAYSDSEDKPSLIKEATSSTRTSPSARQPSRAKFFVCDSDEEEEEEEEEEFFFPRRSEDNFGDCEDSGTDEAETEEQEGLVVRAPNTSSPQSAPGMVRRQSLLSDLFSAEKQREQPQYPSKPIRPSMARTSSTYSSRCPSAANSDGESTFSRMAPVPEDNQVHGHHKQHHHHQYPHHINLDGKNEIETEMPKSPLVRTKRVFKNLDELASLSTSSPTCNISSLSPASPSSSIATSTSPTALAAWTRSHQVQVQIQSLVVQSTSSAQRALLSASATLTDVLFRTK